MLCESGKFNYLTTNFIKYIDMRSQVQNIFMSSSNANKQVMMFSATMDEETKNVCRFFMKQPFELFIDSDSKLTLHGLKQYYVKLEDS